MEESQQAGTRVLFMCGRNEARSQMAEGFLRTLAGSGVEVASAGVRSGTIHPLAVRVMQEAGVDVSSRASKAVRDLAGRSFDVVITLCDPAREFCLAHSSTSEPETDEPSSRSPVLTGVPVMLHWAVDDPVRKGEDEEAQLPLFRAARDRIRTLVEGFVEQGTIVGLAALRLRWQSLVDTLEDGIIAHDSARRIFVFNRAAERILGVSRGEILGRDCHAVFAPGGLCGSHCSFCHPRPEEEPLESTIGYEMDVTARDGKDRRIRMTVSPLELVPGKPWGVIATVRDLTEVSELRRRLGTESGFHGMVGVSPAMRDIFETIQQISSSDYPVLVTGESGTGKELVAGAIHETSRREGRRFVPINCGALPDNILESELFGHVRGAFTGAIRDKKGRFELAHGGTIFLDEVGELSPAFQVKLLRVLEEKRFEMVGGERTVEVDVRVVSATNRDLRQMVEQGAFREDLFYRLCVVPLEVPPLRDRPEDIPLLVEHTLERIRMDAGTAVRSVADEAMALMLAYRWPGNVRELINALQYATVQCRGEKIQSSHLPLELRRGGGTNGMWKLASPPPRAGRRRKLDPDAVKRALEQTGGNKARAARLLGVGRATLYRFLRSG
jgi:PAS domain S-box-containing protein